MERYREKKRGKIEFSIYLVFFFLKNKLLKWFSNENNV